MSKVATRTANTTNSNVNGHRRSGYPMAAAGPSSRVVPAMNTSNGSSYTSRRLGGGDFYRVDEVIKDGVRSEVIVIEDTPPPEAGPSGSASAYASSSRYDSRSTYEPAPKKRKSDGAFISDQPYSHAALTSSHYPPYDRHAPAATFQKPAGPQSKNKRKYDAYEGYSAGRDSGSARDSYRASQKEKDQPSRDKEGHFIVRVGDYLGPKNRYRITRPLGQGTFGKVVCAYDSTFQREVAVKVIRAVPKYREASKVEIKVLKVLKNQDPTNIHKCIHLLETFEHKEHVCLVTELLSSSVFDFLKDNQYQAFPFSHIQHFARQLLQSVAFLHSQKLVHTDLKPENILLEDVSSTEIPGKKRPKKLLTCTNIRLIDFGSATFENEYHATVVSTRHYRAPEIIIGTGWSYPCDVWSIGCILIEFFTGEALFQTHENLEHLAMMERVFGPMPEELIRKVMQNPNNPHHEWFKEISKNPRRRALDWPSATTSKQSAKFVRAMRSLNETVKGETLPHQRFKDLLSKLLQWDPAKRCTVDQALTHEFFTLKIHDEGSPRL